MGSIARAGDVGTGVRDEACGLNLYCDCDGMLGMRGGAGACGWRLPYGEGILGM